jgi:hypothetical protein
MLAYTDQKRLSPDKASGFSDDRLQQERLPFIVRIARNEQQLQKAIDIRCEAYERHWPNLSGMLRKPETQDRDPNSLVILAESKIDGAALGTLRIDTNLITRLAIEREYPFPEKMVSQPIAYVTRLGVKQGRVGTLVKLCLFKSLYRFCLARQVAWILAGVRPPNDRDYVKMGFSDLNEGGQLVPIGSSGGIPVRLMALDVIGAERAWHAAGNPLYKFMCNVFHPDVEIFSSVVGMWGQPRRQNFSLADDISRVTFLNQPLV